MIKVSYNQEIPGREYVAGVIKGWSFEVKLLDGLMSFDGSNVFRAEYLNHDADCLYFDIYDKKTGLSTKGVNSTGFGWEMIESIQLLGLGRVVEPMTTTEHKPKKQRK